jgi:putative endonuclease
MSTRPKSKRSCPPIRPERRRSAGTWLESRAIVFLQGHGLELIERNYSCPFGEIDLIMKSDQVLVFVEVRFRTRADFVHPLASVNYSKQRKIVRTAQVYLKHHRLTDKVLCRLDVLGITRDTAGQFQFDWIRNAFSA